MKQLVLGNLDKLSEEIKEIHEELDDHREAINANALEIQSFGACIGEFEARLERVESFIKRISEKLGIEESSGWCLKTGLTEKEKAVWSALYGLTIVAPFTTYKNIAKKTGLPEQLVAECITAMIEKGVPLIKRYEGGSVYIGIKNWFRELQAKKNVLGLELSLTYWQS